MVAMMPRENLRHDVDEQTQYGGNVAGDLREALVRGGRVDAVDSEEADVGGEQHGRLEHVMFVNIANVGQQLGNSLE